MAGGAGVSSVAWMERSAIRGGLGDLIFSVRNRL